MSHGAVKYRLKRKSRDHYFVFIRRSRHEFSFRTPAQTAGPFYPGEDKFQRGFDLTSLPGHAVRAQGQVIYVRGRVLDKNCQPVEGVTVEIWQACYSGRYNNPSDTHNAPLDPNFKYWSEVFTNEKGEYAFKTIKPGSYPAGRGWIRPPHIHFKIAKLGYRDLITQMYFQGEPLNEKDFILLEVPAEERSRVIIDFRPSPSLTCENPSLRRTWIEPKFLTSA